MVSTPHSPTDPLAEMAVAGITPGMTVGLGTGRAATRAIHALARRVREEGLRVSCVATSVASDELGRKLGLDVQPMERVATVDYLFDGADEVDPQLRMVKGRGGAMTREKIVAAAAAHRVYLIDEAKLVARLGEKMPLPIEVMSFGLSSVTRRLEALGLVGPIRQKDGRLYVTDNGNVVIDAELGPALAGAQTPEPLAQALDAMEGVVDHGLFLSEAHEVLVESAAGSVKRMTREQIQR